LKSPVRLQEYGVGIFNAALSKSALKKALKKNYITVNEVIATTATLINGGEIISLSIPDEPTSRRIFKLNLKVLFEDEHLAIIHKPAGVLVSGNNFKTIANALSQNIGISSLPDAVKPQAVHRLDFATTGLLLIGKTRSSIRALNKMFENKEVQKIYYAVTIGNIESEGIIDRLIDGKESKSIYTLCESVSSEKYGKLNLVKLAPLTGRRHQLRKHLSNIGSPILGDKDYGIGDLILKGKGMYLHAYSLMFVHPFTNNKMCLIDELPLRFNKIFVRNIS